MKIGILTLSASYNCGSMLQCYALKHILSRYGEVEVINYSSQTGLVQYDIVPHGLLRKIRADMRLPGMSGMLIKEHASYEAFKKSRLGITGQVLSDDDLSIIHSHYDVIVTGSDQIWNYEMSDFSESFFAGWFSGKKIAYGPSLGGRDLGKSHDAELYKRYLHEFSELSAREQKGADSIHRLTEREIPVVADPTLLLDRMEWEKLIGERIIQENYIFYYSWSYCFDELLGIVHNESISSGLPVYVFDPHKWRYANGKKLKDQKFKLAHRYGPEAFLNLMYYADKVFVESFHGMIFAYIFEKDFKLLFPQTIVTDDRLRELMELLDVEDSVLSPDIYRERGGSKPLRICRDNHKLSQLVQDSRGFLNQAFDAQ